MLRCNLRQLALRGIFLRLRRSGSCALGTRVRDGNRAHQRLRIRVRRVCEHLTRRTDLNQTPPVHHAHPITQKLHHREVVRDEEERKPVLALEMAEQIHDLRLNGHVE